MKKNHTFTKFAIVAALVGVFSPSVNIQVDTAAQGDVYRTIPVQMKISLFNKAEAKEKNRKARKASRRNSRRASRHASNRKAHRVSRRTARRTSRRTARRTSRRTSRRVIYRHNRGRYYVGRHGVRYRRGYHWGVRRPVVRYHRGYWGRRPVVYRRHYGYWGRQPIVGFATGLAVGSIVAAPTMPRRCVITYVRGVRYKRCGRAYYRPYYRGRKVVYKVVRAPY